MAPTGRTEPGAVCLDADVVIAGLLSRTGASHAILILGEIGLLTLVLPEAVVDEVRRNLTDKLPEPRPLFEEFLRSVPVRTYRPTSHDRERARPLADLKDVPIRAAAIGAGAPILVTLNVRPFRSGEGVRVVRPRFHGGGPRLDGDLRPIAAGSGNRGAGPMDDPADRLLREAPGLSPERARIVAEVLAALEGARPNPQHSSPWRGCGPRGETCAKYAQPGW